MGSRLGRNKALPWALSVAAARPFRGLLAFTRIASCTSRCHQFVTRAGKTMGPDTPPKAAEKTLVIDIMFWGKPPTILNLEIDMIKFPTILTRRSMFRAGAGLT